MCETETLPIQLNNNMLYVYSFYQADPDTSKKWKIYFSTNVKSSPLDSEDGI
jgi:hypothetical protein